MTNNWICKLACCNGNRVRSHKRTATSTRPIKPAYTFVLVEGSEYWPSIERVVAGLVMVMTQRKARTINEGMSGGRWVMMAF